LLRRAGDGFHGGVKRRRVVSGRLAESADLAHVLQRGGSHVSVGNCSV